MLLVLILGAMFLWGPALFLVGLISLMVTRAFLRKAASAKGRVRDINEVTPAHAYLPAWTRLSLAMSRWISDEQLKSWFDLDDLYSRSLNK